MGCMKIWKISAEVDQYDNLMPVKEFSPREYNLFDGTSLRNTWKTLAVQRMEPEKKLKLSDFPGFTIPVLSEKALVILKPYLANSAEELELFFQEKAYVAINVTAVLDVIDYEKSVYKTFSDGKRIMFFEKYAFKESPELMQHHIFKIVDEPRRSPFVSDEFKKAVEDNHLTGFRFKLVWDSEETMKGAETEGRESLEEPKEGVAEEAFSYIGELDADVTAEIEQTVLFARKVFKIHKTVSGRQMAETVYSIVEKILREGKIPSKYDDLEDVSIALGCLFGQALVTGLGWKWKEIGESKEDAIYCVVSPDENYVNPCMAYLQRILGGKNIGGDGKNDNTVMLLWNMAEQCMKKTPKKKLTVLW